MIAGETMTLLKYQKISDDIRHRIRSGELSPGDQLPTAVELAKQLGVATATVIKAFGILQTEGLVRSEPARGTFVQAPRRRLTWSLSAFESNRSDSYAADAWALWVRQQGSEPSAEVRVRRIMATAEIAGWLEVREGDTVVVRDRIRSADGQPYMVSRSYFPKWVAAGTRLEEPGDQSAPGGLLVEVGHPQVRVRDTVEVAVAEIDDARDISLAPGSMVWTLVRIGYGRDGRPVRAMQTVAPLDLLRLEFDQALRTTVVSSPFNCSDFAPDPYPGARPDVSFVEMDGAAWVLDGDSSASSGWSVDLSGGRRTDLDDWLTERHAPRMADRLPLLAYGSNASPGKLEWLRGEGLAGPSVVVTADVEGAAAVWASGLRVRDDQRPAVLAAVDGAVERHAVWFVTPDQRRIFDGVEGRGQRYRLVWVHLPVILADGQRLEWVLAYVAQPPGPGVTTEPRLDRSPLLVNGEMVTVVEVSQDDARTLSGESAPGDGLDVIEVSGDPDWSDVSA